VKGYRRGGVSSSTVQPYAEHNSRVVGHIQVSGVERLRDAVNNHGQQARICGAGTRRNGWDTASCQDFLKITKGIKNALARHFEWKALG
jgi:hypothetical protein